MNCFKNALAAWIAIVATSAQAQKSMSLDELLTYSDNALSVMRAEAELESNRHKLKKEQSDSGLSLFASAGYGRVRDVIDVDRTRYYNSTQARLGAKYPLLGTAEADAQSIHEARGEVASSRSKMEAARNLAKLELEMNYARYWRAQEKLEIVDSYLSSRPKIERLLDLRVDQNLMLESEKMDLLSVYQEAKVDKHRYQRRLSKAMNRIQELAGKDTLEFEAKRISLQPIGDVNHDEIISGSPELQSLQAKTEAINAQIEDSNWYGINADIEVSTNVVRDTTANQTGGGWFAGFNVSAPLSFLSARKAAKQELKADRRQNNLEYREKTQALISEAKDTRDKYEEYLQEIEFTKQRTKAAERDLREYSLRSEVMEDQNIEDLAKRLGEYYRFSSTQIDAYADAWLTNIEARMFMPSGNKNVTTIPEQTGGTDLGKELSKPIKELSGSLGNYSSTDRIKNYNATRANYNDTLNGARVIHANYNPALHTANRSSNKTDVYKITSVENLAVYLWDSDPILQAMQYTEKFWNGLTDISVDRILLALNSAQINEASSNPERIKSFISKASEYDIKVELLLGEPTWIEPENREKLTGIIHALSSIDFSGLHLDIEPNQQYRLPLNKEQFDKWLMTMAAAAKASPWPMDISVHHRFFREQPYKEWRFSERLIESGIDNVTLMIYNSRPKSVAAIASPIINQNSSITFQIAQSVESILSKKLSHHHRTPDDFEKQMSKLENSLSDNKNFSGIVIQDWNNLMKIGYESTIL